MKQSTVTRKEFIRQSAWVLAGAAFLPGGLFASTGLKGAEMKQQKYTLKNVRLETGFVYEEEQVVATRTELFCIDIENGIIKNVRANQPDAQAIDARGMIMLPAFKDMHIHLDKTLYGDAWRAVEQRKGGVKGMIALEQEILPGMLKHSTQKAEKLIELLQSKGTAFARSHVNIEPTSGLESLRHLQTALEHKKKVFGAELVAFPQHGVFYTDAAPYMKEAAQAGVDFIGGVDPFTIDGGIEKTMDFTVQLALDYHKGIDIHLHETGASGLKTVEYLIRKVNENPSLKGKTYLSHCFVLGKLNKIKQQEMAEKLAEAQIGIISTIPFAGLIMPIPTLMEHGVTVMTGNDSIIDHWSTFGTGSVLHKVNVAAQVYGHTTEFGLSRMLKLATAGPLPLSDKGVQQWPKAGDTADLVFLEASCSAEAIARLSPVTSLIYQGNIVF